MGSTRIGLALSAVAAGMVSLIGGATASADITSIVVHLDPVTDRPGDGWNVEAQVGSCGVPWTYVAFTDNGKPLSNGPVAVDPAMCGANNGWIGVNFVPTTLGTHHIVAQQQNADGSVVSTMSKDVNITHLPGASSGSSALPSGLSSGS